jgi:prophage maintenance system killer protein
MTLYLNREDINAIHNQVIEAIGGSFGIRDAGTLESAIDQPQATLAALTFYRPYRKRQRVWHIR